VFVMTWPASRPGRRRIGKLIVYVSPRPSAVPDANEKRIAIGSGVEPVEYVTCTVTCDGSTGTDVYGAPGAVPPVRAKV
jgi:hypothetical protein